MYYPFGPLAPDRPARLNDQFLRVADGVFPMADGYRPVGQWASIYTALAAAPKGGASFVSPQGAASIIVGTATNLYKAESGAFTSIGSGYSIQGDQRWRFAQFGGLAIATNAADAMLKIDLATFTVSNLGGSPPKFESLGVVKDFLVGTCRDGDIMTIGWCALNNAEFWTVGQRQSDYNIMPAGGRVNGILSGEFGVILQRDRICGVRRNRQPAELREPPALIALDRIARTDACKRPGFRLVEIGCCSYDDRGHALGGNKRSPALWRRRERCIDRGPLPNRPVAIGHRKHAVSYSQKPVVQPRGPVRRERAEFPIH